MATFLPVNTGGLVEFSGGGIWFLFGRLVGMGRLLACSPGVLGLFEGLVNV